MNAPTKPEEFRLQIPAGNTAFTVAGVDRDKRTVIAKAATAGAKVRRYDCNSGREYDEELVIGTAAIDTSRMVGAPVLDSHDGTSATRVIGVVTRAWIDGDALKAEMRFAADPLADLIFEKVATGIVTSVSIGYSRQRIEKTENRSGIDHWLVTRWTPVEISIVPIPSDPGAKISARAQAQSYQATIIRKEGTMPNPAVDEDTIEDGGAPQWSARNEAKLRKRADLFGQSDAVADIMRRTGDLEEATDMLQQRAFDAQPRRTPAKLPILTGGLDDPAVFADAMATAIAARHNPKINVPNHARQFVGMSMVDVARACLEFSGHRLPVFRSPSGIIESALQVRSGQHSTADFPGILGDAANKSLRMAYAPVDGGVRLLARKTTNRDFKERHRLQADASSLSLKKVNESGEFKYSTIKEMKASYRLNTYGTVFAITRQALVNDDLGAFDDFTRKSGQASAAFEAAELVALIESNPVFAHDGLALFHATHSNLAGAGAAIAEATLSAARLALRKQTGLGSALIQVTPKYLLVSATRETEAEKIVSTIQAATTDDVNVFAGKLKIVVDPRLSANPWYLAADPDEIDGLEYAYLEGEEGPQLSTRAGFEVDGMEFKIRLDFGCGFTDWRGWYKNPGA